MAMTAAGKSGTSPEKSLPVTDPIEEMNVIAKEEAIVILVGIRSITSMIGTSKNAPPAPTIPAPIPTIKAEPEAIHLLKDIFSDCSLLDLAGMNIITTAIKANIA